jgi:hypothetical protein
MALSDYEELAARSFDEPGDPELRAAVLVCADALLQIDDPRGPLIAMEHALHEADDAKALELRREMHEHAAVHFGHELAAAAPLMYANRTLSLEWRSGLLYGASVDARYFMRKQNQSPSELVRILIEAPVAKQLRRLRVRVRTDDDVRAIDRMLHEQGRRPPLEELAIYTNAWPSTLTPTSEPLLSERFPNLYYAVHGVRVFGLPPTGHLKHTPKHVLPDVMIAEPPTTPRARRFLGRALCHGDVDLRVAALERVTGFGPQAKVFERLLCTLLQPLVASSTLALHTTSKPHLPIVTALRALGPSRYASRVLEKVASRPEYYDAETRQAAGSAAAELRPA